MSGSDPIPSRREAIARIRTALIEKKMTQAELADAADCHEKTIQNMLSGRSVRDQTLFDVCMVLGLNFEQVRAEWTGQETYYDVPPDLPGQPARGSEVAPIYMGAYTKPAVDHLIGSYLTLRPGFSVPELVIAYRTNISWDPEWPSLVFEEFDRPDAAYNHRGRLHVPSSSMFIHFVSLTKGSMRMTIVSQLDQLGIMRGLIATVSRNGPIVTPVSGPIVYLRRVEFEEDCFGEIGGSHRRFQEYREALDCVTREGFARLVK